jgi:hypothetical protein
LLVTPYSVSTRGYDPVIIQFTSRKGCARAPASAAHRLARPPILGLRAAVALGCDLEGAPMRWRSNWSDPVDQVSDHFNLRMLNPIEIPLKSARISINPSKTHPKPI